MRALRGFLAVVLRDPLLALCAVYLIAVVLLAFVGIYFTGYKYDQISNASLQAPSWAHWFGTDVNGHDLLTRTLFGAQISLMVAAAATLVSLIVGVPYGMISGYAGGRVDNFMMRVVEILLALPTLVLVIVVVTSLDAGTQKLLRSLGLESIPSRVLLMVVLLGLTEWLTMARIVRGQMLVLKELPYIGAANALGQSHARILWKHLLPNLSSVIVIYMTLTVPAVMLDESFMSFLGVGVTAPLASWGTLVSDAAFLINPVRSYWWLLVFPGLFMTLTLLALNFLGDGLRDALDPRTRK